MTCTSCQNIATSLSTATNSNILTCKGDVSSFGTTLYTGYTCKAGYVALVATSTTTGCYPCSGY